MIEDFEDALARRDALLKGTAWRYDQAAQRRGNQHQGGLMPKNSSTAKWFENT